MTDAPSTATGRGAAAEKRRVLDPQGPRLTSTEQDFRILCDADRWKPTGRRRTTGESIPGAEDRKIAFIEVRAPRVKPRWVRETQWTALQKAALRIRMEAEAEAEAEAESKCAEKIDAKPVKA